MPKAKNEELTPAELGEMAARSDVAKAWARKIINMLKEADEEISKKNAIDLLAKIDAEQGITADMDNEELDYFLDEFEEAIMEEVEKDEELKERKEGNPDSEKRYSQSEAIDWILGSYDFESGKVVESDEHGYLVEMKTPEGKKVKGIFYQPSRGGPDAEFEDD